jgi:outer membrane protein TolC
MNMLLGPTLIALLAGDPSPAAPSRTLTLEDAEQILLRDNAQVLATGARARGTHDTASSVTARMLPSLHLSEEYQHYNDKFAIAFGGQSFVARLQDTNTLVLSADQPLIGLLRLNQDRRSQESGATAAEDRLRVTEASVRQALRVGFLRYFEAQALQQIAQASEAELEEQVQVARAKLGTGVLTKADVLRVEVAAANAKQQEIQARAAGDTSRSEILGALGLAPDDASVQLVEPTALLTAAKQSPPSYTEASRIAIEARPELAEALHRSDAAFHRERAALFAMLPDVDAEAAYLHVTGQVFAPVDSAFVGIRVAWAVFEFGATWNARRAAEAEREAAELDVEGERRQVNTEVASRLSESVAAANAVKVAEETIASADEAFRVTEAQVKAGVATTTDLLDSQAALTQARLNRTRALYEQAIVRVGLERALGH